MVNLPGCSSKSAEKKPAASSEQKPKAPPALKNIASELDTIIDELDKKVKALKPELYKNTRLDPAEQQGGQSQEQEESTDKSETHSQGQSGSVEDKGGSEGSSKGQGASPSTASNWQKEYMSLKNIHNAWNSLEPDAVEGGLSVNSRNAFEKALQELTTGISNEKLEESLMAAINLYKYYAELTQVFKTQVPPEFYQVKHVVMAGIFEAGRGDWTKAQAYLPAIEEHWAHLKMQAKDTDPKVLSCTEFALKDLEDAIKAQQIEMVVIKGEIAMNNLKSLEEKLSSKSSSGEG